MSTILDITGRQDAQDAGILQVGWANGILDTACGQDEQNTKYY